MKEIKLHKAYDFIIGDVVKFTTVFIHGIAGDADNFKELMNFLKENADFGMRVVAFDLLGAGKSPSDEDLDFGYKGQLKALERALAEIEGPIVLVGHSMGTLIATRYAAMEPDRIQKLVLISPPIYTEENLASEEMRVAMEGFMNKVKEDDSDKINTMKAFDEEIAGIVKNPENYKYLAETNTETRIIYGAKDKIIAAFNIPGILKINPLVTAVETDGGHSVTPDKFQAVLDALREE